MIPMTQYLMSVLDDTAGLAMAEEMAAIDAFNEQLQAEGHWVFAGGLASPSTATVVDGLDGEPVFTDGPYVESKEHIGGFWIIEAPHLCSRTAWASWSATMPKSTEGGDGVWDRRLSMKSEAAITAAAKVHTTGGHQRD
jgi:hypothetical protein